MLNRRVLLGTAIGVILAVAFVGAGGHLAVWRGPNPTYGPVLSDCTGTINELVIQYVPEAKNIVGTAYRQFLRQLPERVTVYVECPDQPAFDQLLSQVGDVPCQLVPVTTGHAMTPWSRDRWLAMRPKSPGMPTLVLAPATEKLASIWPQRRGDLVVAFDLANSIGDRVEARRSPLLFDGGDFVADGETVFVTPDVLRRNMGVTVETAPALETALRETLTRDIVLLTRAPEYHAGMFMMLTGNRTALVGDPSLAHEALQIESFDARTTESYLAPLLDTPDFSPKTQADFDAVAAQCKARGYRVIRIPTVPAKDQRTYLTYLNVIIDQGMPGDRPVVYMPVYRGVEPLNSAAASVWRDAGYDVKPVDCTDTYRYFGSLRCLVNVLTRTSVSYKQTA